MHRHLVLILILVTHFAVGQPDTDIYLFDIVIQKRDVTIENGSNISNNPGYDNQPSFISDNELIYAGTRNGQTDIRKYDIEEAAGHWLNSSEGSEYSPLQIPGSNRISAIRLETNGDQKLHTYNPDDGSSEILVDDVVIGYQVWFDQHTLVASILEENQLSLIVRDINAGRHYKVAKRVGRSLHRIPGDKRVSFISKSDPENWTINAIDPQTMHVQVLSPTLGNEEVMAWLQPDLIVMGKGAVLYLNDLSNEDGWREVANLSAYGISSITRLAVSPNGKTLAVVAESERSSENSSYKLEDLAWIAGQWKGEAMGGTVEENWSQPTGGSMMATFKFIKDGAVVFYEIEIIRESENGIILQLKHFDKMLRGWESSDETVDFRLINITGNKAIFEGMTFERIGNDQLRVTVESENKDGSKSEIIFNYTRH